ncbi:hypothetical protein HDU96_008303 [Phlyctochytrium bullatum]|nr:hypothetical protein HDU96_008303 [Phlyctochytrium bullatum]
MLPPIVAVAKPPKQLSTPSPRPSVDGPRPSVDAPRPSVDSSRPNIFRDLSKQQQQQSPQPPPPPAQPQQAPAFFQHTSAPAANAVFMDQQPPMQQLQQADPQAEALRIQVERQRMQLEHQQRALAAEQHRVMELERQLKMQQQQQQQQTALGSYGAPLMARSGSAGGKSMTTMMSSAHHLSMDSGVGSDVLAFAHQQLNEAEQVYRSEILGNNNGNGKRTRTTTASSSTTTATDDVPASTTAATPPSPAATVISSSAASSSAPHLARTKSSSTTNLPGLNSINANDASPAVTNGKIGQSGLSMALDDLLAALGDTINELQDEEEENDLKRQSTLSPPLPSGVDISQFTVAYLLQNGSSTFSGFLNKLSISRATGSRIWKRRFLVLSTDARLFLFRSSDPIELPLTFLPLISATGGLCQPTPEGGGGWVLELRGEGLGSDGTPVERVWSLQCPDEGTMTAWLDQLQSSIHSTRYGAKRPSVASASSASGSFTGNLAYPGTNGVLRVAPPVPVPIPSNPSAAAAAAYFPQKFPPAIQTAAGGIPFAGAGGMATPSSPLSTSFNAAGAFPSSPSSSNFGGNLGRRPSTATSASAMSSQASRRPSSAAFGLDHYAYASSAALAATTGLPSPALSASSAASGEKHLERERLQRMQYEAYLMQMARAQQEAQQAYDREQRERAALAAASVAAVAGAPAMGGGLPMGRDPSHHSPLPGSPSVAPGSTAGSVTSLGSTRTNAKDLVQHLGLAEPQSVPTAAAAPVGAGPGPLSSDKSRGRGDNRSINGDRKKAARSKSTRRFADVDMSMFV